MSISKITVLIVEDQLISRLGLRLIIERFPDFEVIAEAGDGQDAVEQASKLKPAVTVMDLGLPLMDGIEATKKIKQVFPDAAILILTSHDHDDDVFAALAAGADGYCLKDTSAENLASAIRVVSQKAAWLDPSIAKRVLQASVEQQAKSSATEKKRDKFSLSGRENEVLVLLVEGLTNQQMADRLNISSETVKTHMRHIMEKLAVSDRTQVAVQALKKGLLSNKHQDES